MLKLTLLLVLISYSAYAQVSSSSITKTDIQLIAKAYEANQYKVSPQLRDRYPINKMHGIEYTSFLGKVSKDFDASAMAARGIQIGSRIGDIISIRYPLYSFSFKIC